MAPSVGGSPIQLVTAPVEELPFDDAAFDTVICTHLIEHLLEPRCAIAELRRMARRRLIVVVPREREYRYTSNLHFNFYPYPNAPPILWNTRCIARALPVR